MSLNPKNIRFRLIAWYIFSLGLVHLLVGTGMYQAVAAKLHQELDERLLRQMAVILTVVLPLTFLLASWGAWGLLHQALQPLREIIRAAQAIQARDFTQRLRVPETGDEVEVLAKTFNAMADRLERSFTQMRQFVSDASHELRTPLAVLKGEIELGLKSDGQTRLPEEILEACAGEINRMSRLLETLLFLSHADAERIPLDLKPIHVVRLMEEMGEQARVLAEAKRIHVEVVHGHNATIRADEMRLKQLLLNLIDNAVKYTPEGGRITLGFRTEDGAVELAVADTGVGIEPQDLPRVFDRFYRADRSRNRAEGGHGLGLAIGKWISEAHHGTLQAESSPGKGSIFRLRLPANA